MLVLFGVWTVWTRPVAQTRRRLIGRSDVVPHFGCGWWCRVGSIFLSFGAGVLVVVGVGVATLFGVVVCRLRLVFFTCPATWGGFFLR